MQEVALNPVKKEKISVNEREINEVCEEQVSCFAK